MTKLIETTVEGNKVVLHSRSNGDQEIYVDGIHGLSVSPHVVKFNLYTAVPWAGRDDEEYREVAARVTMTLQTFVAITRYLNDRMKELSSAGIITIQEKETGKK